MNESISQRYCSFHMCRRGGDICRDSWGVVGGVDGRGCAGPGGDGGEIMGRQIREINDCERGVAGAGFAAMVWMAVADIGGDGARVSKVLLVSRRDWWTVMGCRESVDGAAPKAAS